MAEEVLTHSAEQTTAWGREFAKKLTAPVLVLLSGELGQRKNYPDKRNCGGPGRGERRRSDQPHIYAAA